MVEAVYHDFFRIESTLHLFLIFPYRSWYLHLSLMLCSPICGSSLISFGWKCRILVAVLRLWLLVMMALLELLHWPLCQFDRNVDMGNDDPGPGGVLGQVLQRPQQGALPMLELFRDGNENLILDCDRRVLCHLAGVARKPARCRSEAVLCALRCLSPPGTLHSRLAVPWTRNGFRSVIMQQ